MGGEIPIRTLRDFCDALRLDEKALERLLDSSDSVERVWAVWALGLRASEEARTLAKHLAGEPAPGVRRALAVVLAGQGRVDWLIALSRQDPNAQVRASAAQLLIRFAMAGRGPWSVVQERFADVPEVREVLLGQIAPPAPPALRAALFLCLADETASVRLEACEAAVRLHAAGQVANHVLTDWLNQASPEDRDRALVRWLAMEPQASLVHALAEASQEVREQAIRRCPSQALADVLPLLKGDAELFRTLHFDARDAAAPTTLVVMLASLPHAPRWDLTEAERRLLTLDRVDPNLAALLPALRGQCAEHLEQLDALLASPEALADFNQEESEEISCEEVAAERAIVSRLHSHIERLLASAAS